MPQNKLYFLIVIMLFIFANTYSQRVHEGEVLDQVIAVIGDNIVLESELKKQSEQYEQQGYDMGEDSRCFLIEELLYQKLLLHQAEVDSVEISENQVDSEMDRRLRYFIQQVGSKEKLEEYYQKSIVEIKEEFRGLIREQLLVQTMQSKITKNVKVTPSGVRSYYKSLPEDSLPLINSEVEVAHIVKFATISQEEREKAITKLKGLKKRIEEEGASFKTLAVLYSQDEGSATMGGELGFMGRGELVPEYSAAAFDLEEGEISDVVETSFGFHIIQLLKRKGQKANTRHILIKPEVSSGALKRAEEKLDSIRQQILNNDTVSFSGMAEKLSDDEATKFDGGIISNPNAGGTKFEMDQLDPRIFSIINELEEGEISKPTIMQNPGGRTGYRLLMLKTRTKPHRANLKDDYQRLQETALQEKKNEAIEDWMDKKINSTYVRINDEYQDCSFTNNWLKSH